MSSSGSPWIRPHTLRPRPATCWSGAVAVPCSAGPRNCSSASMRWRLGSSMVPCASNCPSSAAMRLPPSRRANPEVLPMKNVRIAFLACASLLAGASHAAVAADPAFDAELASIQQAWAHVNYEIPAGDARVEAFDSLEKRAEKFTHEHPARAEALIWEGIIESSYAGAKGGL